LRVESSLLKKTYSSNIQKNSTSPVTLINAERITYARARAAC